MKKLSLPYLTPEVFILFMLAAFELLYSYANADISITVDDGLISFSSPLFSVDGSECQGVRIARELVVTSPSCAQALHSRPEGGDIDVVDVAGNVQGQVRPDRSLLVLNPLEQKVLLEMVNATASEFDTYPVLKNSDILPAEAFAYFKDGGGSISKKTVSVTLLSNLENQQRLYDVASEISLPSGTMVMDKNDQLICLISLKNKCASVPHELVFMGRRLKQSTGVDASALTVSLAQVGAVLVVIGGSVGVFYLALLVRAANLPISESTAMQDICCCKHCNHWGPLNTALCALGTGCFPFTGGYSGALCWAAPFIAAWEYLNAMTSSNIHDEVFGHWTGGTVQ